MLEYVTRTPRSIRAEDIIDYYSHRLAFGKPLELWHKRTKLDGDRLVGRMQGLIMKEAEAQAPAHHQPCSPGECPEIPPYPTPREAYDLGMRSQPAWHGKLPPHCTSPSPSS